MERVAFLIERTGERISCLLNPESLVLRRTAGLRTRQSAGGLVVGSGLLDDPLFYTGGGTTELTFNLLFDVQLAVGSSIQATDVRELTGPLWRLSENIQAGPEQGGPPRVRFVWGKAMNVCGIVAAVAERLEEFTPDGTPQRAWLRMRMLRVAETEADLEGGVLPPPKLPDVLPDTVPEMRNGPSVVHSVAGEVSDEDAGTASEALPLIAWRYFGDSASWRLLAWVNGIVDPLHLRAGQLLRVPAAWDLEETPE